MSGGDPSIGAEQNGARQLREMELHTKATNDRPVIVEREVRGRRVVTTDYTKRAEA